MHLWITHDTKFIRNSHWSPWYPPLHLHVWFNSKQNNNVQKHIKKTHTNHILQYSTNKTTEITITCHTYVPGKPQAQTIKFQHSCCPSHRQTANPDITDYKQWINSTYDITHEITSPPYGAPFKIRSYKDFVSSQLISLRVWCLPRWLQVGCQFF